MLKKSFVLLFVAISFFFVAGAIVRPGTIEKNKIEDKLNEAGLYSKKHQLNSSYCILVDMSIHSGKNRLFVYDFKQKKIIISGLCAHGSGGGSTSSRPVYSNEIGSNCTSLGKYKLGKRSYSKWGINLHYKMHGLEKTNSNAYKRIVVLHSYDPVPGFETYPLPMFRVSSGCPVVANTTMRKIDKLIKTGEKNILLWIYE